MSYMDEIAPDVVSPHDSNATADQPLKHLDTVIALYDFPGTQPSHLPLNLGDTVYVLSKSDTGWWDGVVISNNELQRGWFPHNYVRSVNYVQPVLNKLKSNKEIDSITAANTAANVLIPSFTSLLQKNFIDSEKNSPATASRKNSVVSFASSETSIPSDSKINTSLTPSHQSSTPSQQSHQTPLTQRSLSHLLGPGDITDSVEYTDLDEAERLLDEYKLKHNKTVTWVPKCTTGGDSIFYCEALDIYCESIPYLTFDDSNFPANIEIPSKVALSNKPIITIEEGTNNSGAESNNLLGARQNSSFDPLKRDSNASSMNSQSSGASSFHKFSQPFFATENLFYKQHSDLSKWSEVKEEFLYLLDLSFKALKDYNKLLFSTHFFKLHKLISLVFSASRLAQDDFINTKYEKSIRRKLKKIAGSFVQVYINGILHLSVMHYSQATSEDQLFSMDITKLNRSTGGGRYGSSVAESTGSSLSTLRQNSEGSNLVGPNNNLNSISSNLQRLTLNDDQEFVTYFQQIEFEVENLKHNMTSLTKIFLKLTVNKKVRRSDYDGSDASEDEGEDRYDILPQVYPRFITDEFNGGNWCNPFFASKNPALNVSGDDKKNRYHSKVIIDNQAYDSILHDTEEMTALSRETLKYLDPEVQHLYFNDALKGERNTQILRLIYKFLNHASSMVDLIESFDFTVFCLIKRYSSDEEDPEVVKERLEKKNLEDFSSYSTSSSPLTFDYPVVLDFFQLKQQFHDLILKIIMCTQSLTLDDPEVFRSLKEEDPVLYNRDILKIPTEKAALLLTNILSDQVNESKGNAIALNPDTLMSGHIKDGINFFKDMLTIIQQLIDERETILNYATRVMHDDFNVQLLMIERNNTILSTKSEEGDSYYSGGQKKSTDTPWYLEGDDEFDLLLDMKGNIKGGTKEALISHLTHHDMFDSNFNASFLLTFATIMTLGEFIGLLINRFNIEAPEGLSYEEYNTWISKKQNTIRLRVMNIMKLLVEKHWCDSYYNELVVKKWLSFAHSGTVQNYSVGKQLANNLVRLMNGEQVYIERKPVIPKIKPPAPLTKGSLMKKIKLLDIDYIELARQLTLREFKLYSKITKFACLAKVWGKKSGLNEPTDHITAFIKASNQLTNYVAYMILRKTETRKRVQIIRYFVQVAEKCRQYNNFSSMTAIISALYSSPIHRLKKTWKFLNADALTHLQNMNKLMNSSRNFNEYRDVLKFVGSEPCVPFFGVTLSDLTFVYHGNPDYLMNRTRMTNFAKRAKTCEIVTGIDKFKTTGFNFQEVLEIQKYLDSWFDKCPTIEEQYQLSLNLEPREVVQTTSTNSNSTSSKSGHSSSTSHSHHQSIALHIKNQKVSNTLSSFAFKAT
ncbi:ras GEF [Suhomyces tanzawaensis NRRL Y-17324]|uniref:Ras GEF n=1 Tax=Suhomyces tanzawaensis NRRL Y-17324 TaxID=984487 RepID=A0A1E4SBC6_9ASCO|nr:ras GEF [Suhomyces tanzawaensis NRRL Y-17324]ODV76799.1 ras GEF [Suhomyces tanzawaensis NRRL Y-17324]